MRCAGANSPAELWDLLSGGRAAGAAGADPIGAHFLRPLVDTRPHWAGLLERSSARFDPEFFGVSPREAEVMDPQLRLFLEVAWAALEDAGPPAPPTIRHRACLPASCTATTATAPTPGPRLRRVPYRCWEGFSLANRLSQLLGFHGPSLAVDTACSSSGTALHLAAATRSRPESAMSPSLAAST